MSLVEGLFREAVASVEEGHARVLEAPTGFADWLRTMFPRHFAVLASHHQSLWRWAWAITRSAAPDPFVAIWARGGGKSTTAEGAAAALGVRGARRYALYVRATQERADDSVSNIAGMLESPVLASHYPAHADRKVGKHGNVRAWRRNRVWTAGGFVIDAIGLDTAARGVKLEEQRPDLIILDDLDEKHDTPATTAKKIATLTTSLLPAGSTNVAVLAIQNLILRDGIFTRLADGRAEFLSRRTLSGPVPALEGLAIEMRDDPETGTRVPTIVAGTPTWAGQGVAACQHLLERIGPVPFRVECQHEVKARKEGLALNVTEAHRKVLTPDQQARLPRLGQVFGGIDFGAWRFGFVLRTADDDGVVHQLGEYFSQRESLEVRAKVVHGLCQALAPGARVRLWGDAANPQDIIELNVAFRRMGSPLRVHAVKGEHKARAASVERINDHLDRRTLYYRTDVVEVCAPIIAAASERPEVEVREWRLGWNAGSEGQRMQGSRLWWELGQWSYPTPVEGVAQTQDPDDKGTADGADMIAADRYALMSFWRAGKEPEDESEISVSDPAVLKAHVEQTRKLGNRRKAAKRGHRGLGTDNGGW